MAKSKNPFYAGIDINFEALNWFPDNEVYDNVFIYDDKNIDYKPNVVSANDFYGDMVSSIPMPTSQ